MFCYLERFETLPLHKEKNALQHKLIKLFCEKSPWSSEELLIPGLVLRGHLTCTDSFLISKYICDLNSKPIQGPGFPHKSAKSHNYFVLLCSTSICGDYHPVSTPILDLDSIMYLPFLALLLLPLYLEFSRCLSFFSSSHWLKAVLLSIAGQCFL